MVKRSNQERTPRRPIQRELYRKGAGDHLQQQGMR